MTDQITTKPFVSQAQAGWAFATRQPWAKRWARETGPYKKLPPKVKRKAYTLDDLEQAALKDHDPDRAAQIAATLTLKGEQLAPGVSRIRGDLCNVHGRYGSCSAAGYGSKRVAPKKLPKGRKGRAPAKPKLTPEQRAQQRQAEQQANRKKVLEGLGIDDAGQAALAALREGKQPDPAALARMGALDAGLVEQAEDGSYRLTASGRAMLAAADTGDAGRAGDTISGARDRTSARHQREEAAAQRKRDAEAKRAAAAAEAAKKKPKAGGGGKGSSGSTSADREAERQADRERRQREHDEDRARRLREHEEDRARRQRERSEDRQAQLEARRSRGTVPPTQAADRVTPATWRVQLPAQRRKRQTTTKASTPTRTTDAGHTGVMVALFPDQAAARAIAGADGVTEPQEQLHLMLCFLGDSTEQPLATNKEKVIAAVAEWAQQHGRPLKGVVNGLGRFFHSEKDGTNAVYVSPDVPGLPELRQSLADWIERSGFDYSQDHGFTPHITVAYVPEGAPTPPIRVETPIAFDHVTLAWGDEHYDLPLGITAKSFAVFKDATGAWRWLSRTTTAFEDRDNEVISTKALSDSAASDAPRGPLRFWHMGRPDPLSTDRPWGPGVDLGWCDFAALSGKTLIESGTFKSDAIAEAVAAKADQLELSPGFFHAAGEPDASGVFHHIRVFERSLVPKWAGRASNRYTGLVVEKTMDPKKIEALQALGLNEAAIKELLAEVATTEKAAEADGVRYKAEPAAPSFLERLKAFLGAEQAVLATEPEPVAETPAVAPSIDAQFALLTTELKSLREELAALKAAPPMAIDAEDDPALGGDSGVDEATEGEPPLDDTGAEMSWDDVLAGFGALLDAKLGPLVEALGITSKLDGHMGELKSLLGGYVKQKAADEATQAQELATVKAQLTELVGDVPRGGFRPSASRDNTLPALLATAKAAPDGQPAPTPDNPFADLVAQLMPGLAQQ